MERKKIDGPRSFYVCGAGKISVSPPEWTGQKHERKQMKTIPTLKMVMRYYADPSAVHVENVRVVDLL